MASMTPHRIPIILPVETQVREMDAKLLIGCVAAERGHETYVGFQNSIREKITSLPPGIFIAKGFASQKARFLKILHRLGFAVAAWDEEGLVHFPPQIYYKRRISKESLALLNGLFSWGPDYTSLIQEMPFYDGTPLFETGNPRIDLLRREVRSYFNADVEKLHQRFGRYILLNSNFGRVNSVIKRRRDANAAGKPGDPTLDKEWMETFNFRKELYGHFRSMLSGLAQAFPDYTVLLRPHPAENIDSWRDLEMAHPNVRVIFEGNVIPWLMGAEVLVHNGCTTAIESVLLEKPAIAFQPIVSKKLDWQLPNSISHSVSSLPDLISTIRNHLDGKLPLDVKPEQRQILDAYVAFDEKRLASDLIVDSIQENSGKWLKNSPIHLRALGWIDAEVRAAEKRLRSLLPNDIYAKWHQEKQFPRIGSNEVNVRIGRLAKATGRFLSIEAKEVFPNIFALICK